MYCHGVGHWVQTCYELHGYPMGHPKANYPNQAAVNNVANSGPFVSIAEDQLKQLLSLIDHQNEPSSPKINAVAKSGLSYIASRNWIINNGVTDHITSSPNLLHKIKNHPLPFVSLPSGERTKISGQGKFPLNSVYYLHDVLSLPTFKVDLIFVSRLTHKLNCSITFYPHWCILQDLATRKMIGLGKQRGGLYYLMEIAMRPPSFTRSSPPHRPYSTSLHRPTSRP